MNKSVPSTAPWRREIKSWLQSLLLVGVVLAVYGFTRSIAWTVLAIVAYLLGLWWWVKRDEALEHKAQEADRHATGYGVSSTELAQLRQTPVLRGAHDIRWDARGLSADPALQRWAVKMPIVWADIDSVRLQAGMRGAPHIPEQLLLAVHLRDDRSHNHDEDWLAFAFGPGQDPWALHQALTQALSQPRSEGKKPRAARRSKPPSAAVRAQRMASVPALRSEIPIDIKAEGLSGDRHALVPWAHIDEIDFDVDEGGSDGCLVLHVMVYEQHAGVYDCDTARGLWLGFGHGQDVQAVLAHSREALTRSRRNPLSA